MQFLAFLLVQRSTHTCACDVSSLQSFVVSCRFSIALMIQIINYKISRDSYFIAQILCAETKNKILTAYYSLFSYNLLCFDLKITESHKTNDYQKCNCVRLMIRIIEVYWICSVAAAGQIFTGADVPNQFFSQARQTSKYRQHLIAMPKCLYI